MRENDRSPIPVYKGDLVHTGHPLRYPAGLLITGSVRGVELEADGDVYIRGHAHESEIRSATGRIAVAGAVSETRLYAGGDVLCGRLRNADVRAGHDIHLLAEARQSTLQAGGNLHVKLSIEYSLQEVEVRIGGGVVLDLQLLSLGAPPAGDRQHLRVPTGLEGAVARHGPPPFQFQRCRVTDLSRGGLRCTLAQGSSLGPLDPGMLLQVKLELPGEQGQILAIARVARVVEGTSWGLAFLTMAEHDRQRLQTYCLQHTLTGSRRTLHLRHNRRADLPPERLRDRVPSREGEKRRGLSA